MGITSWAIDIEYTPEEGGDGHGHGLAFSSKPCTPSVQSIVVGLINGLTFCYC